MHTFRWSIWSSSLSCLFFYFSFWTIFLCCYFVANTKVQRCKTIVSDLKLNAYAIKQSPFTYVSFFHKKKAAENIRSQAFIRDLKRYSSTQTLKRLLHTRNEVTCTRLEQTVQYDSNIRDNHSDNKITLHSCWMHHLMLFGMHENQLIMTLISDNWNSAEICITKGGKKDDEKEKHSANDFFSVLRSFYLLFLLFHFIIFFFSCVAVFYLLLMSSNEHSSTRRQFVASSRISSNCFQRNAFRPIECNWRVQSIGNINSNAFSFLCHFLPFFHFFIIFFDIGISNGKYKQNSRIIFHNGISCVDRQIIHRLVEDVSDTKFNSLNMRKMSEKIKIHKLLFTFPISFRWLNNSSIVNKMERFDTITSVTRSHVCVRVPNQYNRRDKWMCGSLDGGHTRVCIFSQSHRCLFVSFILAIFACFTFRESCDDLAANWMKKKKESIQRQTGATDYV